MKKVHIKKPDIKGTFHKIKNLKKEDIKAHWKESKHDDNEFLRKEETASLQRRCSRYTDL